MNAIHIAEPGGRQTVHSEEEARSLWHQGTISPQAYYWREGMAQWRPAGELFGQSPASLPMMEPAVSRFAKDPTTLTRFLKVMLWISLCLACVTALIGALSLATGNAAKGNEESFGAIDALEMLAGLFQLLVFIVTGIPFLMWIHRANRNARALGAQGMQFTPGWSVGWYFIPVLNLWKPYQAMKEIWQASHNPFSWRSEPIPSLLGNWWGLWLLTNFLGQMTFRLSFRAQSPQALTSAAAVGVLSDVVDVALCLVGIRLVTSIYRKQAEWAQRPAGSNESVTG
jgi:hypothetical protein